MYAITLKVYCDHEGCEAEDKADVHMTILPAVKDDGAMRSQLIFHPDRIDLPGEGTRCWTQGWDGKRTAVMCPIHEVKR